MRFTPLSEQSGIRFDYYGGPSSRHYMTEQNGGGVALADFDNDNLLDVFLANGSYFHEPAKGPAQAHQLFRALGSTNYVPVADLAGLQVTGFGMGCAAGDTDNDGFCDLFVSHYGPNRLWRNNGDGTFQDVCADTELSLQRWSTSAAFADLDDDGDLDLYVVNYVDWSKSDPPCFTEHNPPVRITCGPLGRPGQPDQLFENLGDGRFSDVGPTAGVARPDGKGLALGVADLDGDRRLDVYVANDTTNNSLFQNIGGLRFEDVALAQGAATDIHGKAQAGMGVGCADFDGDERLDLCVTNFENEVNNVYLNLGEQGYLAHNASLGLDAASRPSLGFGVVLTDFDQDGWPDLFVANGHVWDLGAVGAGYEFAMSPHLFQNRGGKHLNPAHEFAGEYFSRKWLGRAAAYGDLDNDGDADLVVTHLNAGPAVLQNESECEFAGMRVHLVGRRSARQPLGRQVRVRSVKRRQVLLVPSGQSFQSSSDPRVLIPVRDTDSETRLEVQWSKDCNSRHDVRLSPTDLIIVEPLAEPRSGDRR